MIYSKCYSVGVPFPPLPPIFCHLKNANSVILSELRRRSVLLLYHQFIINVEEYYFSSCVPFCPLCNAIVLKIEAYAGGYSKSVVVMFFCDA